MGRVDSLPLPRKTGVQIKKNHYTKYRAPIPTRYWASARGWRRVCCCYSFILSPEKLIIKSPKCAQNTKKMWVLITCHVVNPKVSQLKLTEAIARWVSVLWELQHTKHKHVKPRSPSGIFCIKSLKCWHCPVSLLRLIIRLCDSSDSDLSLPVFESVWSEKRQLLQILRSEWGTTFSSKICPVVVN